MITPDRFIANKHFDYDGWLEARKQGVSATTIAKAATPSGFDQVVSDWFQVENFTDNAYMAFGRDQEGFIGMWVKDNFGLIPQEWLIQHDTVDWAIATPDALSLGHNQIGEFKTTGKDWSKPPIQYIRQVQWQIYVTGADSCLFAWLLREEVQTPGGPLMVPAWFEPKTVVIDRDDKMIADLVAVGERLWGVVNG